MKRKGYRAPSLTTGQKIYLYGIGCGDFIKVGLAINVDRRICHMSIGNPFPLEKLTVRQVRHEVAGAAEAMAHLALKDHHHRGEWFRCCRDQVRIAIAIAIATAVRHAEKQWQEPETPTQGDMDAQRAMDEWVELQQKFLGTNLPHSIP